MTRNVKPVHVSLEDRTDEPGRFTRLPQPIPMEDTITSSEASAVPEEKDDYWREVEWMLRVTGGA
jgi:hypothetical protein